MSNLQELVDRLIMACLALDPTRNYSVGVADMNELERGLRMGELHAARNGLTEFMAKMPKLHVIALDGAGSWVIEHPLSCRRDDEVNLTWCPYNEASVLTDPDQEPGRFECERDEQGIIRVLRRAWDL